MKRTRLSCLLLAALLCMSLLASCGNTSSNQVPETDLPFNAGDTAAPSQSAVDEKEAAAMQLLQDLQGTYQELWPVVLAEQL